MNIEEAIARCVVACRAEAVSFGYPPEAGEEIYQGCVSDDLEKWTDNRFLDWAMELESRYGNEDKKLNNLYLKISEIMGQYAPLLKGANNGRH